MVTLVIINGLGGNGKSTFATYCKDYIEQNYSNIGIQELSTVDIVKVAARAVGWSGGKTQRDRIFLSDLKFCMEKWCDLPIQSVFNNIQKITAEQHKDSWLFFVNSREQVDHAKIIAKAKEYNYAIYTLIVHNPNAPVTEVPELVNDILSETYDYTINNDGTLNDLYQASVDFCKEILKNS